MKYKGTTLICTTVLTIILGINVNMQIAEADTAAVDNNPLVVSNQNKIDDKPFDSRNAGGDFNITYDEATPQSNYYVSVNKDDIQKYNAQYEQMNSAQDSAEPDEDAVTTDDGSAGGDSQGTTEDSSIFVPEDSNSTDYERTLSDALERIVSGEDSANSINEQQAADYYQKVLDTYNGTDNDLSQIKSDIEAIQSLKNYQDFADKQVDFDKAGIPFPFTIDWDSNPLTVNEHVVTFDAADLNQTMPKKDSDAESQQESQIFWDGYSSELQRLGYSQDRADQIIKKGMSFQYLLSGTYSPLETNVSSDKLLDDSDILTLDSFYTKTGLLNLRPYIQATYPNAEKILIINQPFFSRMASIFNSANFEMFKDWLILDKLNNDDYVFGQDPQRDEKHYVDPSVGPYGTVLRMDQEVAISQTLANFDVVASTLYGEKTFDDESYDKLNSIVHSIINEYKVRIENNTWLSADGKQQVLDKLSKMKVHVAYPKTVSSEGDFSSLDFDGLTPYEIEKAIAAYNYEYRSSSFNQPNDDSNWEAPSYTVNAKYIPSLNSFEIYEGLANKPLFSKDNTDSQNYGGIGVVIGHEMSHAFDDNGTYFDRYGNYSDIWDRQDRQAFEKIAKKIVKEYDGVSLFGQTLNGQLTLGENIADNGGLNVALQLAKQLPDYNADEFFSTWAKGWSDALLASWYDKEMFSDEHTPNALRTNIALQNIPDFYATYNIKQGDPMFLSTDKRVNIW